MDDDTMRSCSPLSVTKVSLTTGAEVGSNRRDSSASSDSQKSTKKPASLNEIQDLYSALQDLVKTNVTTTPLPERRTKIGVPSASPVSSPRMNRALGERSLTVPEKALRKFSGKISPASSIDLEKENEEPPTLKHKRGLSTGTMETMAALMRISPFPSRKFSQDSETVNRKDGKKLSTSKMPNVKSGKKDRSSSSSDQKKWKAANKLFKRLRSKSTVEFSSDNEYDDKLSSDEEDVSPKNNRRKSEADALRIQQKRGKNVVQRMSLQEETKQEIDQLVASLNRETQTNNKELASPVKPTYKNPINELNKLESWFEKASAEAAALNPHSAKYIVNDESSSDASASPNLRANRFRKKSGGVSGRIRRANSNSGSSHKAKEERKARRNIKINSKSFDVSNLVYAKSTPDLSRTPHIDEDDAEEENDRVGQLTPPPSAQRRESKISFDGVGGRLRLPDSPLFYDPKGEESLNEPFTTTAATTNMPVTEKIIGPCNNDGQMFYTSKEDSDAQQNIFSKNEQNNDTSISHQPPLQIKEKTRSESASVPKKRGAKQTKKLRPKSMFDYLGHDVMIGEDDVWSSDETTASNNSIKNTLNLHCKDNNANFCRAKIIGSPHTLSLCDLTKTTVAQEKSLWDRFRKVAANKKHKASKYSLINQLQPLLPMTYLIKNLGKRGKMPPILPSDLFK